MSVVKLTVSPLGKRGNSDRFVLLSFKKYQADGTLGRRYTKTRRIRLPPYAQMVHDAVVLFKLRRGAVDQSNSEDDGDDENDPGPAGCGAVASGSHWVQPSLGCHKTRIGAHGTVPLPYNQYSATNPGLDYQRSSAMGSRHAYSQPAPDGLFVANAAGPAHYSSTDYRSGTLSPPVGSSSGYGGYPTTPSTRAPQSYQTTYTGAPEPSTVPYIFETAHPSIPSRPSPQSRLSPHAYSGEPGVPSGSLTYATYSPATPYYQPVTQTPKRARIPPCPTPVPVTQVVRDILIIPVHTRARALGGMIVDERVYVCKVWTVGASLTV
ncbi:hypothetical protein BDV98DRAFT_586456 [Pterulicium gracile]|uniref:Uncharacterized protein n=1 Tax=Pterulicium gracile TaxID=1884261 RepID=A0A5C3Q7T1_9AGAR|nr:hypothetical protein BDV98DRAFT_586456 [Pterula gracilis]